MPLTSRDILFGLVVPFLSTLGLLVLLRSALPSSSRDRYASSLSLLGGFLIGYASLALAPWSPTAHWHWLPYALILAGLLGPVSRATGVTSIERWLMALLVSAIAGWFLVPDWDDLAPSRLVLWVTFTVSVGTFATLTESLADRWPGWQLPTILLATITAAAVVLALSGSLRFAQIAMLSAASCLAMVVAGAVRPSLNLLSGSGLLLLTLVVGSLLVGKVNSFSEVPIGSYVLVPIAPLLASIAIAPPIKRLGTVRQFVVTAIPVIAILAIAIVMALLAESDAGY